MLVWRWVFFWRPLRVPLAKRPGLVRTYLGLYNHCSDHTASGVAPFDDDRVSGNIFFSSNDAVSAGQRGRRRDRERSVLRVRMTSWVEELDLLRPVVDPMY